MRVSVKYRSIVQRLAIQLLLQKVQKLSVSNKIIVAIDVKWSEEEQDWFVYTHGGQKKTDWKAVDWAIEVAEAWGRRNITNKHGS